MQEELVSIITPLYNGERFVAQTIESVLAQTYKNWEMIIINDGSKDNSEEIAKAYSAQDGRIKVFSQENAGSAAARNNGIRRAEGRYIALLDADDLWDANFLESQLNLMKETGAELVYASHRRIDENGKECLRPFIVSGTTDYKGLLKTCSISCLTGLYDSKRHGKVYLREDLKSLRDDFLYWLTIVKMTGKAYANNRIIASYRILGNSASRNKKKVIRPQFRIYYEIEKLGLIRSMYYLAHWAINGFLKYRK